MSVTCERLLEYYRTSFELDRVPEITHQAMILYPVCITYETASVYPRAVRFGLEDPSWEWCEHAKPFTAFMYIIR